MLRKIVQIPHPTLRSKSKLIKQFKSPFIRELAESLHKTMLEQENAVGLAAPQINAKLRMFNMAILNDEKSEIDDYEIIINPKLRNVSQEIDLDFELCFSVPGICGIVPRPIAIEAEYMDLNGVVHQRNFQGLEARVFQHELDHLNGILFTDLAKMTISEEEYYTSGAEKLQSYLQQL